MTVIEFKENYPKSFNLFRSYFKREGWGAESADNLSQFGLNAWLQNFKNEYDIDSLSDFENKLYNNNE